MPRAIDYNTVISMARRMGFEAANNGKFPVFRYESPLGFKMEFPANWLKADGSYVDEQVATQLSAMQKSIKEDEKVFNFLSDQRNVDAITKACIDYGMVYDEADERFYYVERKAAVFSVDHDYIASLVCQGKASMDHLPELLDTFKETAKFEHKQSIRASGKELLGDGKSGKGKGKADA